MNDLLDFEIFKKHQKPLRELSKDDSCAEVCYMTDCEEKALDFDGIKNEYSDRLGISQYPKSVDAILPVRDGFLFIEFKNGCLKQEKNNIRVKLWESLIIFCDILSCTISCIRQKSDFILVYNEKKNPSKIPSFDKINNSIAKLAKERIVRFGFEQFKTLYFPLYFRDVFTLTEREFSQYLNNVILIK